MRPLDAGRSRPISTGRRTRRPVSVGAYQVEGLGIHLFDAIEGDHFDHPRPAPALRSCGFLRRLGCLALRDAFMTRPSWSATRSSIRARR